MLKVTVIGGGSTYTPELIQGFLKRMEHFPLDELWLMDIDRTRLETVGQFSKRVVNGNEKPFEVVLSTNQKESIHDASYVITQFRVGKMNARREDEYLGQRYGLIGQETTGVGGMASALRTIPPILEVARDIQDLAPNALLVNFTNPSGLITEALFRYAPEVNSVGVCNATIGTKMEILEKLNQKLAVNIHPDDAQLKALGLNHLTWFYGLEIDGKDYWPQIMQTLIEEMKDQDDPYFDVALLRNLNMLPNSYLRYFYYTDQLLAEQNKWPPSRAEEVMKIEEKLLNYYQNSENVTIPDLLNNRGGAYYSTVAAQLINAHYNKLNETHILNTRHNGAVPEWNNDWVLELPCTIGMSGIVPKPTSPLPPVCESLITQVKTYEILTAKAAVDGDRTSAYSALLAHPLGPSADKIDVVLNDMLETNRSYLPQFFK